MSSLFGGGGEKWGMKDENINDMRGGRGGGGKAPEKPEHFDARKGNGNHILEILTPPPHLGRIFHDPPLKLPSPPPSQLINNDQPLIHVFFCKSVQGARAY